MAIKNGSWTLFVKLRFYSKTKGEVEAPIGCVNSFEMLRMEPVSTMTEEKVNEIVCTEISEKIKTWKGDMEEDQLSVLIYRIETILWPTELIH